MIRAFLAEWLARLAIQWTFTLRHRFGLWAARLSALIFAGSHRGCLLLTYFHLKNEKIDKAINQMRRYYAAGPQRAKWGLDLESWRSRSGRNLLGRRACARTFSLASSWQRLQPLPRQVQAALWKARRYNDLAELAQIGGQFILQAHALLAAHRPEAALERLALVPVEEWNGEATFVRVKCLQVQSKLNEAIKEMEFAISENGAGQAALRLLVELYRHTGRDAEARQVAERLDKEHEISQCEFKPPLEGRVYHIITEDHELTTTPGKSDGRPWLSLREARIQLVDKPRLVNRIASDCGTPWTHLIDIGSYTVIKAAAEQYPATWAEVLAEFEAFMTETIASGNDLGVHVHSDKSWLAIERIEPERIWLTRRVPGWGQLHRFGRIDDLSSKMGFTAAGKELVEKCGRRARPSYRALFFRAGSYNVGATLFETAESMDAVRSAGLCVNNEALEMDGITESLGRTPDNRYSLFNDTPWIADHARNGLQASPLRTRDFPVYSIVETARRYFGDRRVLDRLERNASSVKYLVAIDHDTEIGNAKAGGQWDDLNPASGDWKALADYLRDLGQSQAFSCVRAGDLINVGL